MDPFIAKLLDYGALGIAVLTLGWLSYKLANFIVAQFDKRQEACTSTVKKMEEKLDQKDAIIVSITHKCFASIDENTKVTKELVTEIRQRRISDSTPKGNKL